MKSIPGLDIFWMAIKQINPIEKSQKWTQNRGKNNIS